MEPFSIATGVVQLISFADTLVTGLAHFIGKTISIPDYIQDVHDEIISLREVVKQIENTLNKRARQQPFERNHHAITHNIVQKCTKSLKALEGEIPPLKDGSGILQCVWRSIEHSISEERIRQITENIRSYKSTLNISLTTLLLFALSETEPSHQQVIQMELRKLRELVQSNPLFSRHTDCEDLMRAQTHSVSSTEDGFMISIPEKEIRDWRQTVDDVATGYALSDVVSCDARSVAQGSSVSVGVPTLCDDNFDPEPGLPDEPDSEILAPILNANKTLVQGLMKGEMFTKASSVHRKGINHLIRLRENQDTATSKDIFYKELVSMREELVDILLRHDSEEKKQEAMGVLQRLLEEVVERNDRADYDRRARLNHKLGELYYKRGSIKQARRFARRALHIRQEMEPMPRELAEESARLLVRILQEDQAFDEANGYLIWIRTTLHQDTLSASTSSGTMHSPDYIDPISAYQWCKENGSEYLLMAPCQLVSCPSWSLQPI
ncbi:hypothetical protein GGR53DRAFT_384641 [Hypoxylon sp. FL1150]|nr:hypothetical protein GGR53DRAFT_384641 [Hypoxylon sp. FL1150]